MWFFCIFMKTCHQIISKPSEIKRTEILTPYAILIISKNYFKLPQKLVRKWANLKRPLLFSETLLFLNFMLLALKWLEKSKYSLQIVYWKVVITFFVQIFTLGWLENWNLKNSVSGIQQRALQICPFFHQFLWHLKIFFWN